MGLLPDDEGGGGGTNGLGNLADELADAWSEDDDEEEEEGEEIYHDKGNNYTNGHVPHTVSPLPKDAFSNSIPNAAFPARTTSLTHLSRPSSPEKRSLYAEPSPLLTPSIPKHITSSSHHKRQASDYDGSEYGDNDEFEADKGDGIPPSLQARMDMVESLARRGTDAVVGMDGLGREGVVERCVGLLRDLGAQGGVESGTTRYVYFAGCRCRTCALHKCHGSKTTS